MEENFSELNKLHDKIIHFVQICISSSSENAYTKLVNYLRNSNSEEAYINWQFELKFPFDLEYLLYEVMLSAQENQISTQILEHLISIAYKAVKYQIENSPRISAVWTGPITKEETIKLNTYDSVKYLLNSAKEEIFIVGYSFSFKDSKIQDLLRCIEKAVERNCRVNMIVNDVENNFKEIMNHWKKERYQINVYYWRGNDFTEFTSLHAKLFIVDQQKLLLTSANFSFHGLHKNIETGVIIENHDISKLILKQYQALIKEYQIVRYF